MTFDEAVDYLEDSSYDVERTIEAVAALREVQAALAAAQPAEPDCPACGWQNDQEGLDCEAAYEKATGRKLEPGDKEFLGFRAGWIAGHTRAALPAQGWVREKPTKPGMYFWSRNHQVMAMIVYRASFGSLCWFAGASSCDNDCPPHPLSELVEGWWMPASVPTPPNAEPKEVQRG